LVIEQSGGYTKIKNHVLLEHQISSGNITYCFQGFDCMHLKGEGIWRNSLHLKEAIVGLMLQWRCIV